MSLDTEYNNTYWQFRPVGAGPKFSILTQAGKLQAIQALAERGKFEGRDYEIKEISIPETLRTFCSELLQAEGQILPTEGAI